MARPAFRFIEEVTRRKPPTSEQFNWVAGRSHTPFAPNERPAGRENSAAIYTQEHVEQPDGRQNVIVVGASAGGVEAYQILASGFPSDLPAAS
jgi:chemotaxis response regulator CheB